MPKRPGKYKPSQPVTRQHKTPETEIRWGNGRGGRPWRRKRDYVLKRDKHLCQCDDCLSNNRLRVAHEVDHITPLSQGGTDEPSNLRAINRDCHKAKTARESKKGMLK